MATSPKKVAANRVNAQKSHGPINTTSTRYNATKHGLLAQGLTELDNSARYQNLREDMLRDMAPVGPTETFLVETAALEMVRLHRARQLEAEYITSVLNPPTLGSGLLGDNAIFRDVILDPGLPASVDAESAQKLVNTFQRYESTFLARLFRTLHEFERLQRMRKGEALPAPAAVDVTVHADAKIGESSADLTQPEGRPTPVDATLRVDTKIASPPSSDLRQIEGLPHAADVKVWVDVESEPSSSAQSSQPDVPATVDGERSDQA